MGAWGAGAFENDDALDWIAESADLGPLGVTASIEAALWPPVVTGLEPDRVEVEASVLAACETIATALGRPGPSVTDEIREELAPLLDGLEEQKGLPDLALRGLDFVGQEGGALAELWSEEAETAEEWQGALADLRARLTAARQVDASVWTRMDPSLELHLVPLRDDEVDSASDDTLETLLARETALEARVAALEARDR